MSKAEMAGGLRLRPAGWSGAMSCGLATLTIAIAGFALALPATADAAGCAHARASVFGASHGQLRHAVVCLINAQRRERGLPSLHTNRRLNRSAQHWTNHMVADDVFTHGPNFAARITAVGFDWSTAGENIATGFSTPASVVGAWMASDGHCHNILTPVFRSVGTGVSAGAVPGFGGDGTWTQDFGLHMGARAPSHDWGPADGCPY